MKKTVITIARSYGSGGRTLGKLLAEELGINCYDREILRMASDDSGINEALFGQTDEKLKQVFEEITFVSYCTQKSVQGRCNPAGERRFCIG